MAEDANTSTEGQESEGSSEKTAEDVARTLEALRKERDEHKETRRQVGEMRGRLEEFEKLRSELDATKAKLENRDHGLDDEKVEKLIAKRYGTILTAKDEAIEKLTAEHDALRREHQTLVVRSGASDALLKANVRPVALDDALDKVSRFFEAKDGALVMRDLETLKVSESQKKKLLTAKGDPVDLEAFASGYLREFHPIYFPAEGGSGAAGAESTKTERNGAKKLTQEQAARLSFDDFKTWRESGGTFAD